MAEQDPARIISEVRRNVHIIDQVADDVRMDFADFLKEYQVENNFIYIDQANEIKDNEKSTLFINFNDVQQYRSSLADLIKLEYYRFEPYLRKATQSFFKKYHPTYVSDQNAGNEDKEFQVSFYNLNQVSKLRDLKTERIGHLISISGTVTRTSEVRPELVLGTFICLECGISVKNVPQHFRYTEPLKCTSASCGNRKRWKLDRYDSKFSDWQKVRLQESTEEIPPGSMPRSIDVILRAEICESVKPGDKCVFTGCLIVMPDVAQLISTVSGVSSRANNDPGQGITGLKALGVREMSHKLAFLASSSQPAHVRGGGVNIREDADHEIADAFSAQEKADIIRMKDTRRIYDKLARCIAPSVSGHDEIKRGILLMLFGGVHKTTTEKTSLRGDINVCIVGDPSTSKSQFLKYVNNFLPRSVYTSGKASSAAGLTASVSRDPETGEFGIEAGALMLADNGICCIDEFDKMDPKDQAAIHEAMEQQTISISKAGIQATLNARTSILAAANPINGRYDRTRTLKSNLNISAPIMSRFDLFFVVLDECNPEVDMKIAAHILEIHQNKNLQASADFSTEEIQRYIKFARRIKPMISEAASTVLVDSYKKLRLGDSSGSSKSSYRITVRQLESLIRLSESLARLHCSQFVEPEHVREAERLLEKSIIHVDTDDISFDDEDDELPDAEEDSDRKDDDDNNDNNNDNNDETTNATPRLNTTTTHSKLRASDVPINASNQNDMDIPIASRPVDSLLVKRLAESSNDEDRVTKKASKPKLKITNAAYMQLRALIIEQLKKSAVTHPLGITFQDLMDWYNVEKDRRTADMEEIVHQSQVFRAILKRLIEKENLVLATPDSTDYGNELLQTLLLNPNFDPSTM